MYGVQEKSSFSNSSRETGQEGLALGCRPPCSNSMSAAGVSWRRARRRMDSHFGLPCFSLRLTLFIKTYAAGFYTVLAKSGGKERTGHTHVMPTRPQWKQPPLLKRSLMFG